MDPQKIAKITGWLFIATFVTSIPARLLFVNGLGASWNDMRFIPGAGSDTAMYFGAILEFLLIVTSMGTAIFLYPIVKRQSEVGALGYFSARVVENAFILVGLISIISVVTVRENLAGATGAEAASLTVAGSTLVNTYEWAFLFGPGLVAGIGNGIILGYLMYRSGLIPPTAGHVGAHRWPTADRWFRLRAVRGLRDRLGGTSRCNRVRVRVGAVVRYLSRRQRLQAFGGRGFANS